MYIVLIDYRQQNNNWLSTTVNRSHSLIGFVGKRFKNVWLNKPQHASLWRRDIMLYYYSWYPPTHHCSPGAKNETRSISQLRHCPVTFRNVCVIITMSSRLQSLAYTIVHEARIITIMTERRTGARASVIISKALSESLHNATAGFDSRPLGVRTVTTVYDAFVITWL